MRCLSCGHEGIPTSTINCPRCGAYLPSVLRDVLPPGALLQGGKYRIDYALGRGGFGITYRAMHVALEQLVAIKEFYPQDYAVREGTTGRLSVAHPEQDAFERGLKRFLREGKILAKLNHPNVVRVQDFFEERGTAYLVMELLTGRSLRDELNEQPSKRLPIKQVETVIESLVTALAAVHQQEVYHLDLKPENVLLTPEGRVVLVDFGAAKQGLGSQTTQACTIEYAPLEVLAASEVGTESDLFELGMMMYEMLTGEIPTPALGRIPKDTWKPKYLEEPWQSLVTSALRLHKEERPKSVLAWWQDTLETLKYSPSIRPLIVEKAWDKTHSIEEQIQLEFEGKQVDRKELKASLSYPSKLESATPQPIEEQVNSIIFNVDYEKLKNLLAAGKWKEADQETKAIMLKIAGRQTEGWLDEESIKSFPCEHLYTIDQLWVKYSDGRFGLSVQKQIFEISHRSRGDFAEKVGWRGAAGLFGGYFAWKNYEELQFTKSAPKGHLPVLVYMTGDPRREEGATARFPLLLAHVESFII